MVDICETIYEHCSGNKMFTITAAEPWSKKMVYRLKEKYPNEDIRHTNKDESMVVHFPLEWMRIVPKRRDTLTDEQRADRSEKMKEIRAGRANTSIKV